MADSKAAKFWSIATRLVPPLFILAVGWFGYATLSIEPEERKRAQGKPRAIKTQVVELLVQDYPTTIETQGDVRPHNQITLNSEVSGMIVRISSSFEDGAFFTKGELLLELDTADFKAALTTAEAQVARTTASHALEQAQANQARESWEKLALDEDPDPLVLRIPQLRQAEANMKSAAAQYERAQRDLERTQIRAPFDGRVRQRNVGIGQSIRTSTNLGTIFASDYAEVRLPISGNDLPLLDLPEAADDPPVHVDLRDTLNPENETVWESSIIRTEGALDPATLELFAIAKVDDPFGLRTGKPPLRIGQPVTATVSGKVLPECHGHTQDCGKETGPDLPGGPEEAHLAPKDHQTHLGRRGTHHHSGSGNCRRLPRRHHPIVLCPRWSQSGNPSRYQPRGPGGNYNVETTPSLQGGSGEEIIRLP